MEVSNKIESIDVKKAKRSSIVDVDDREAPSSLAESSESVLAPVSTSKVSEGVEERETGAAVESSFSTLGMQPFLRGITIEIMTGSLTAVCGPIAAGESFCNMLCMHFVCAYFVRIDRRQVVSSGGDFG
jgi:hypothetical protein